MLGQSWDHLWMTFGFLWCTLRSCWQCWGHLGVILGGLGNYLGPPWCYLGSCWGYDGAILGLLRATSATDSLNAKNTYLMEMHERKHTSINLTPKHVHDTSNTYLISYFFEMLKLLSLGFCRTKNNQPQTLHPHMSMTHKAHTHTWRAI